jgi:hypothetical protein
VVENVGLGCDHHLDRAGLAKEVRGQDLDGRSGRAGSDRLNHLREMSRAAVSEVVPVHGGDDHVLEAQLLNGDCDALGFVRIEGLRQAGLDVAEGAGPRARIPHDHERGVLLFPALPDIRAPGLFADGHELVLAHDAVRFGPLRRSRRLDTDPVRLALDRLIRPMSLFRVAGTIIPVQKVKDDGHRAAPMGTAGSRPCRGVT